MEIFMEPKKLPCDHVFCLRCLRKLHTNEDLRKSCPMCRNPVPEDMCKACSYPSAHHVSRLVDIYYKSLQEQLLCSGSPLRMPPGAPACPLHVSQSLALYCDSCEKNVCRDCVLTSCSIMKHSYVFLKDLPKQYEARISKHIEPIKQIHEDMSLATQQVETDRKTLDEQKNQELGKVSASFDALIHQIDLEKSRITTEIKEYFDKQAASYAIKHQELNDSLDEVNTVLEKARSLTLEEALEGMDKKLAKQKPILLDIHQNLLGLSLHPLQHQGVNVQVQLPAELFQPDYLSFYLGNGFRCDLHKYKKLQHLLLEQLFQIEMQLTSYPEKKAVCSKLCSTFDGSSTTVTVTKQPNDSKIHLDFVPQKRGRHELHIQCGKSHICGSPINAYVYFEPQQISQLKKQASIILSEAKGIKCYQKKLYITRLGAKITILEHHKKTMTSEIALPANAAEIHDGYIYYTDSHAHKLVKATMNGQILMSKGGKGVQEELFNFPSGIRMSQTGEIFVCDTQNHRIQVFDQNLTFQRIIGEEGVAPGQFCQPNDLVLDNNGNIYVVESKNHRVQVLTPQGGHIRFIGLYGGKKLSSPTGADIYNKHIYVTDAGRKNVSVYTLTGEFVATLGDKDNIKPEYIAIDDDGFIYVTNDRKGLVFY